jgi:putative phage-type endonuclease
MSEQGTPEWLRERAGRVTASRIADVMSKGRGSEPSATRKNYMAQIVAEVLTGEPSPSYSNAAMQWGTDTEPQARAMYEIETGVDVAEVGFVPHPRIEGSGASPDGLVGDDGLVEIKCPNTATHIETLRGAPIDRKYLLQMHWQMLCTGRKWCDFVSFDPRLPVEMQMHVRRVHLDADLASEITDAVTAFITELNEAVAELRGKYGKAE